MQVCAMSPMTMSLWMLCFLSCKSRSVLAKPLEHSVPVRQSHLVPARIRHGTRHPMCRIRSSCAATCLVESAQCRSTFRSRLHDTDDAWHRRREASLRVGIQDLQHVGNAVVCLSDSFDAGPDLAA